MQRNTRVLKPFYQKQNQPKLFNKRTDLLASLHNIKLPLQHSQSLNIKDKQFQSVLVNNSQYTQSSFQHIHSYREHKFVKINKNISLTQEYFKNYGILLQNTLKKHNIPGKFLGHHKIDGILRARMLDWMVQVMNSYHFNHKTYFAGIQIMDKYFANTSQTLVPTELHIIGVQSMFIATKVQQVYPLKIKTVYQKIGHKKVSIFQLIQMQNKILQALNFNAVTLTIYDLALIKISKHLIQHGLYTDTLMKQVQQLCSCAGKFIGFDKDVLAQCLANYVLELYKLEKIKGSSSMEHQCRQIFIETIVSFKRKYKGLSNLVKFTDRKIIELVQAIL